MKTSYANPSQHALFGGLDRAAFAAAFSAKLRGAGVPTPLSSLESFASGLALLGSMSVMDLYWMSRITFVKRHEDVAPFDAAFEAVFSFELNRTVKQQSSSPRSGATDVTSTGRILQRLPFLNDGVPSLGDGLRWNTPPAISESAEEDESEPGSELAERLPSTEQSLGDRPFDQMNEADLAAMCLVLEKAEWAWPTKPSRRVRRSNQSGTPSLRLMLRDASRLSGEVTKLATTRRRRKSRRVVMIIDVSGSMESYVRSYLHTCRMLTNRGHMEVFAVGTDLHRLTPALRHRSAEQAMALATESVGDRFGGTKLASSIGALLGHKTWSSLVRGAIVVIASDGWDTDESTLMTKQMARLSRRAHSVIWINPRSAATDFEPKVAAMAAAMPFCDRLLSGHSANAMFEVMQAIGYRPSQ